MAITAYQKLVEYLKNTLSQGYTPEQLRKHVISYGYLPKDVDEALKEAQAQSKNASPSAANAALPAQKSPARPAGIRRRNPLLIIILSALTFGIYFFYWYLSTTNELRKATDCAPDPLLMLLFFLPFLNIFFFYYYGWKYSRAIHQLTGYDVMSLLAAWIFFPPVAIYLSQKELNTKAEN